MNIAPGAISNGLTMIAMPTSPATDVDAHFQTLMAGFDAAQPAVLSQTNAEAETDPANEIAVGTNTASPVPVIPGARPEPLTEATNAELKNGVEPAKPAGRAQASAVTDFAKLSAGAVVPYEVVDIDDVVDGKTGEPQAVTDIVIAALTAPIIANVPLTQLKISAAKDTPILFDVDIKPKLSSTDIPAIPFAQPQAVTGAVAHPSSAPEPSRYDTAITGHLDLRGDTIWLDQLAREIAAAASNDGKLRFALLPQALGKLDIAISIEADGVNIQLQPSTESAARMLTAEQPRLAEELRQSGVKLVSSDLISGHQMSNSQQQSQTPNFVRQTALHVSGQSSAAASPAHTHSMRLQGRFA